MAASQLAKLYVAPESCGNPVNAGLAKGALKFIKDCRAKLPVEALFTRVDIGETSALTPPTV